MNINHSYSPRNSPESNGVAERLNANIKTIFRIYQNHQIDFIISRIHNFHNHLVHSTTKFSPNEVLSGNSIFDPLERNLEQTNIFKVEELSKRKHDSLTDKFIENRFKVEQLVLTRVFSDNKITEKYEGPFQIGKLDLPAFRAEVFDDRKIKWESLRNLKPFFSLKEGEDVMKYV